MKSSKALANEHRLQILNWLKHPKDYFVSELHAEIDEEAVGACVVVGKMWSHRAPLIFFLDDPIRELDWTLGLKEAFSRADSLGLPNARWREHLSAPREGNLICLES